MFRGDGIEDRGQEEEEEEEEEGACCPPPRDRPAQALLRARRDPFWGSRQRRAIPGRCGQGQTRKCIWRWARQVPQRHRAQNFALMEEVGHEGFERRPVSEPVCQTKAILTGQS